MYRPPARWLIRSAPYDIDRKTGPVLVCMPTVRRADHDDMDRLRIRGPGDRSGLGRGVRCSAPSIQRCLVGRVVVSLGVSRSGEPILASVAERMATRPHCTRRCALLRAMGYRTTVTQKSGDGGVDVIASRDPLGIEPPIIKVQCSGRPQPSEVRSCSSSLAPSRTAGPNSASS